MIFKDFDIHYDNIVHPIFWWCGERSDQNVNDSIKLVIPHLFLTIDSLHVAICKMTNESSIEKVGIGKSYISKKGHYQISIPISSADYLILRSVISLVGDIYNLLEPLKDKGNLLELEKYILSLYNKAEQFRAVRNFFTHIDSSLCKVSEEGFHLVLDKGTIYFSYYPQDGGNKQTRQKDISAKAFEGIFEIARDLYKEITSHKNHRKDYIPAESLFK
ncbi:hypothetical protein [Gorillibacterium sp. sgz5001074]|uniref:hypothetical protein n=1 Tax=Gorillibacterium sp. sgz5001074 TaxID=3446695 RepID=UPI003F66B875